MVLFGAGQLQDMLMPIGLAVIDSRFCKWVSKVYRCTDRHEFDDKVPPGGTGSIKKPFRTAASSCKRFQLVLMESFVTLEVNRPVWT